MPQTDNSSQSEVKPSRKEPLTVRERKMRSVARKRETHSALNVFIPNTTKQKLDEMCKKSGLTLAEAIERLIEAS
ncbi:replication protein [Erwinia sp. S63]|mgnify:CR=1 FL=1|uniref:RepB family protein n=1 Tax=Erwinia sp. S63 TaxID=2769341 RepID=UPI00190D7F79|nr:RepB family protein [Erwinia sp. S63]MBK0098908.1 replication protein [Erwinia sp. S63]